MTKLTSDNLMLSAALQQIRGLTRNTNKTERTAASIKKDENNNKQY